MKRQESYWFKNTVFKKADEAARTIFTGPGELEVGPAPEFEGSPEALNPEEMFVASINSCLMTTFFYFVRKLNIEIVSYYSDAEGRIEKQKDGFRFTNVEVRAKVKIRQQDLINKTRELGDLAEKYCLVSRSAACPIQYSLAVQVKES